jgi:hypothetical protein
VTWQPGRDKISDRLRAADTDDEVVAAWIAVDLLRRMYQAPDRDTCHRRLVTFYEWTVTVEVAEITRLASTIDTWQDEVLAFFDTRASDAATEVREREDRVHPQSDPGLPQHGQLRRPQAPRRPAT